MNTQIHQAVIKQVKVYREIIRKTAQRALEFIDITDKVLEILARSGISEGMVLVYSRHTTAAIKINENEPLLLGDMARFLQRVAPKDGDYKHNDFVVRTANMTEDECPNGHAHCQHLLLGASEIIPLAAGELLLGRWQRIFLIELDRPREREVIVQVQGW
ncbi:YjbQ family protein [Candidatus Acetothermia bacterium]|nr:YjbQ family protein [Candidatus Bipolaricaulota bacterium]RLE37368.1 MAG: YjbQ family protein [Candidatus Acetothermia bacterium]RLE37610.1 MAG: YjbQ family protein [Candidatus Acetothermia bacterium]HDJ30219.1 YjbQ family protein [Candidatus Acetothermia bacterium]